MKRLLGVNDGYGSPELREILLDSLNELCRGAEVSDGFLDRITATMRELFEESKTKSRRFTVMREAIIAEQSGLTNFVIRLQNP